MSDKKSAIEEIMFVKELNKERSIEKFERLYKEDKLPKIFLIDSEFISDRIEEGILDDNIVDVIEFMFAEIENSKEVIKKRISVEIGTLDSIKETVTLRSIIYNMLLQKYSDEEYRTLKTEFFEMYKEEDIYNENIDDDDYDYESVILAKYVKFRNLIQDSNMFDYFGGVYRSNNHPVIFSEFRGLIRLYIDIILRGKPSDIENRDLEKIFKKDFRRLSLEKYSRFCDKLQQECLTDDTNSKSVYFLGEAHWSFTHTFELLSYVECIDNQSMEETIKYFDYLKAVPNPVYQKDVIREIFGIMNDLSRTKNDRRKEVEKITNRELYKIVVAELIFKCVNIVFKDTYYPFSIKDKAYLDNHIGVHVTITDSLVR